MRIVFAKYKKVNGAIYTKCLKNIFSFFLTIIINLNVYDISRLCYLKSRQQNYVFKKFAESL